MRLDPPAFIDTSDLRHSKCFETSVSSSSFALPSTGGDLICASHVPSSFCSSRLARELGFTFIWMIRDGIFRDSNIVTTAPLRQVLIVVVLLAIFVFSSCNRSAAEFISIKDPVIALTHVRVIDGTGSPAREDQTIIIESGRIAAIGATADITVPASAKSLDFSGHTAMPGLVGMHDHLFYAVDEGERYYLAGENLARLYLAAGVTTIRTAGAINLSNEQSVKRLVDSGKLAGPKIHLSSPYLNKKAGETVNPQKVIDRINEWADQGVTSLKVYDGINGAELKAIVDAAHTRGLKVTGHLCAAGFVEAAQAGIDNLEHGLAVDTEFFSRKKADECPARSEWLPELARINLKSEPVQPMIRELVERRVAITSTLAIFEAFVTEKFEMDPRMRDVLTDDAYATCSRHLIADKEDGRWSRVWANVLKKEMEFEREFVKAGGLLIAGADPTGWGGVVPGFGDQRGVELLVQAGFSAEEAIRIATLNGATVLGEDSRIGTIATGKQADIVIMQGNPAAKIQDIRNVKLVFKDGVGYDPTKLIESVRGLIGR
jgi:imidazolonepropionase-like amidohydrolase